MEGSTDEKCPWPTMVSLYVVIPLSLWCAIAMFIAWAFGWL